MFNISFDWSQIKGTLHGRMKTRTGLKMNEINEYYRKMILSVLEAILRRSAQPQSGGFINTKLSLFTGRDFHADDSVRGLSTVYSWIQGRGLESLAMHYIWLLGKDGVELETAARLAACCLRQLEMTFDAMENMRQANCGRLLFMHNAKTLKPMRIEMDGRAVDADFAPDGTATMSELFYVKGMAAAAGVLNDAARLNAACEWYDRIHAEIVAGRFVNDQLPLDPKNVAAKPVLGRLSHGPRMIALGAACRFLDITGEEKYLKYGLEYLDYILANHVNTGRQGCPGEQYDMWEFTDENRNPYYDAEKRLFSDSGHATEFTGLAGKLLLTAKAKGLSNSIPRLEAYRSLLPAILKKNFYNGFLSKGFGVCKAFDLISRKPINTDMPWWPLPETMRSACFARVYGRPEVHADCEGIFSKCSDAFRKYFVRDDLNMMAYQTLSADGKPVDVIPATPDADPGYHTNLSIIDCLTAGV